MKARKPPTIQACVRWYLTGNLPRSEDRAWTIQQIGERIRELDSTIRTVLKKMVADGEVIQLPPPVGRRKPYRYYRIQWSESIRFLLARVLINNAATPEKAVSAQLLVSYIGQGRGEPEEIQAVLESLIRSGHVNITFTDLKTPLYYAEPSAFTTGPEETNP